RAGGGGPAGGRGWLFGVATSNGRGEGYLFSPQATPHPPRGLKSARHPLPQGERGSERAARLSEIVGWARAARPRFRGGKLCPPYRSAHPTNQQKNNPMIDGKAIQAARRDAHMSRVQLARAAGMSQRALAFIEQGQTRFSRFLPQIAKALGRKPSEFDPDWAAVDGGGGGGGEIAPDKPSEEIRRRLDEDYAFFAEKILRIRTKSGAIKPLVFNRAQSHVHAALEAQRQTLGRVRALILKGRQQGCSTYI